MTHTIPTTDPIPRKGRLRRRITRLLGTLLAATVLATGSLVVLPATAQAVPKGAGITVSGRGFIGTYTTSSGVNTWCVEMEKHAPAGFGTAKTVTSLPAYNSVYWSGKTPALSSATKMRQLAYIMDKYKSTKNNNTAAAVAIAIWRIREAGSTAGNTNLAGLKADVSSSLWSSATTIVNDAVKNAVAPGKAKAVASSLSVTLNSAGTSGSVKFPAGTTKITLTNAKFTTANSSSITITSGKSGNLGITPTKANTAKFTVTAKSTWKSEGAKGWDAELRLYSGTSGDQRLATYTAGPTVLTLTGNDSASVVYTPLPTSPNYKVSSQAQPSADLGGTMTDTAIITTTPANLTIPTGQVDFTAYLIPTVGAPKYDGSWDRITEAGDPVTVWADADGAVILDANGDPITVTDPAAGEPSGTGSVGGTPTDYPVAIVDSNADPDADPEYYTAEVPGDPVTVRWTQDEIDALWGTPELCTAQPIYTSPRQAATTAGRHTSPAVDIQSSGTIYWSERFYENGTVTHTGECGLSNEKTVINMPGVETEAQPNAQVGETIKDTAIITGTFDTDSSYALRFNAYKGKVLENGEAAVCAASNRIDQQHWITVTGPGRVDSDPYLVKYADGTVLWWVEELQQTDGDGETQTIHTGECGLANETTLIEHPEVTTKAVPDAVVGDYIYDTAIITGNFAENANAKWEVTFEAYREAYKLADGTIVDGDDTDADAGSEDEGDVTAAGEPVCTSDNRLFKTGATTVTGPGEYESEKVVATTNHVGADWWVETLWLTEGDGEKQKVHVGECGLPDETTVVTGPEVTTKAIPEAYLGEYIYDTAIITGDLTQREGVTHEVTFAAYDVPEGHTPGVIDADGADSNAVCSADNLLFETEGVAVTGAGEYDSPRTLATAAHVGDVWWIETLWLIDGDDRVALHVGKCGLPNETTTVIPPTVTTKAVATGVAGVDTIYDTATVTGPLSTQSGVKYTLIFRAYQQPAGSTTPVCTTDTEVWVSDEVVVTKPGEYQSPGFKTSTDHAGKIFWVESLEVERDGNRSLAHVGECGLVNETTVLTAPPLAFTGGNTIGWWVAGAALLLLLGGGVALIAARTRRSRLAGASPSMRLRK